MALTASEKKTLQETHDNGIKVKTVLLGVNGDDGLVGDVKRMCEKQVRQTSEHNKLKRNFYLLVGILTGSGVLYGGIAGISKLIH